MKHLIHLVILTLSIVRFGHAQGLVTPRDFTPAYRMGEVLVLASEGGFFFVLEAGLMAGFEPIKMDPEHGLIRFRHPYWMKLQAAINYFKNVEFVAIAQANYCYALYDVPNDPYYPYQWSLPHCGLPTFWDLTKGASNYDVAIVDSGVNMNHPDLVGKNSYYTSSQGYDFGEDDSDPMDNHGHGTQVAGIAAAATNNGIGIAGSGRNTHIVPVKISDSYGIIDTYSAYRGMWYAQRAEVINCSWGSRYRDPILERAVYYAAGTSIVVAAAGNSNSALEHYPAAYPGVISVGASDSSDNRWTSGQSGSNYGANWVKVAAPGANLFSTTMSGGYSAVQATSMAAPFVAGLLAAFQSYCGNRAEAIDTLLNSCVPNNWTTYGRVDAARMTTYVPSGYTRNDYDPIAIFMTHGVRESGGLPEVLTSDDRYYQVQGYDYYGDGTSWVGRFETQFKVKNRDAVKRFWIHVEAKLGNTQRNTYAVWVRRVSDGEWIFQGNCQQWDGEDSRRFLVSNIVNQLIESDGKIRVQIQFSNWGISDPTMYTDRLKLTTLSQ